MSFDLLKIFAGVISDRFYVIFLGTFRAQRAKTQFASQDVTAKTDSAGDPYTIPKCSFKTRVGFTAHYNVTFV